MRPAAVLLLVIPACGSDDELHTNSDTRVREVASLPNHADAGSDTDAGPPPTPSPPSLPWAPCPKFTDGKGEGAECLATRMPMHRTEDGEALDDDRELDFFVKRWPAKGKPRRQLWLLSGGPGAPGAADEWIADIVQEQHPEIEIYLPDHRGTGRSSLFECSDVLAHIEERQSAEEFYEDCADELIGEWGEDSSTMSVTEAAFDVTTLMAATAREGVPVVGWGASYGCYWLHRILQVGGDLVDSAIFDSPPRSIGGLSDMDFELEVASAGHTLFEACAVTPECRGRLGGDPERAALQILNRGESCAPLVDAGVDRVLLQDLLTGALSDRRYIGLIPPLLYRLGRCTDEDVAFILAVGEHFANQPSPAEELPVPFSFALAPLIHGSEVYTVPVTDDELWEAATGSLFAKLIPAFQAREMGALWPQYAPDKWVGQWAQTDANMLILGGTLDATTPIEDARELADRFSADSQYYFEIEHAPHGAVFGSHEISEHLSCGYHIVDQFLSDPMVRPEGECAGEPPNFEFGASDELLMELVGHTDAWDNPEAEK